MSKPHFTAAEWRRVLPFLNGIRRAVERTAAYRGASLPEVASDVLDGWARKSDVAPLVSKRLLEVVPGDECPACGRRRRCDCGVERDTWALTERGIRLLAPERAA